MSGSYLVLARKYRPKTFDEVVGQDVAKRVLRGAIEEERVGHAYLLSGPRGTGKTTLARIVARSLNCVAGPTPNPCGTCERCVALDKGREVDVVEIDAASHTGVDSIRALRDEVAYAPLRARRKVYIIDEVHMLSKAAFNALLKTLEEPPPHVVFLFATTEPHKVLDTILSRCQVLRLEALPVDLITRRLDEVFGFEGITAEAGVTLEIARGARGGMRDALSKADELLALGGAAPTMEDLARLGSGAGARAVGELLDALEAADKPALLERLAELPGTPAERLGRILGELRRSVLVGHLGLNSPQVEGSPEERETAMARAKRLGLRRLELMLQELLRARERARLLPGEEAIVLEVALLELADPDASVSLVELAERLEALSSGQPPAPRELTPARPAARAASAPAASQASAPNTQAPNTETPRAAAETPRAQPRTGSPVEWLKAAAGTLVKTHASLSELLLERATLEVEGDRGRLRFAGLDETQTRVANDKRNRRRLETTLGEASGLAGIEIEVAAKAGASAREPSTGGAGAAGTAPTQAPKQAPKQASDPLTKQVAELFDGSVEEL
ncbi:MAG: DNA polymerase III subunit gamma/tau [Planctomycetota bacterium]